MYIDKFLGIAKAVVLLSQICCCGVSIQAINRWLFNIKAKFIQISICFHTCVNSYSVALTQENVSVIWKTQTNTALKIYLALLSQIFAVWPYFQFSRIQPDFVKRHLHFFAQADDFKSSIVWKILKIFCNSSFIFWEGHKIWKNNNTYLKLLGNVKKLGFSFQIFAVFSKYMNLTKFQCKFTRFLAPQQYYYGN